MNDTNMLIVSKDRKSAVNLKHVSAAFIGHDGHSLKVTYAGGGGCQLGEYETEWEAREALMMFAEAKRTGANLFFMPDDEAIKARIALRTETEKRRLMNGKKQKGHGGS